MVDTHGSLNDYYVVRILNNGQIELLGLLTKTYEDFEEVWKGRVLVCSM